jgi:hypothetical protein
MTDTLVSQLLDFGALGIFAGFLIWQHLGMQKRLDALVGGFQEQLKDIDDGYDQRIEAMRQRYDVVITELRAECREEREVVEAQRNKLQEQLMQVQTGAEAKLDKALEKLDLGLQTMTARFDSERRK